MNNVGIDTALEYFLHYEELHPNKGYLYQPTEAGEWVELTWQDVGDQARRLASYLKSLNLEEGSRIGVLTENSAYWCIVDLAIMMARHVCVPVFTTMNRDSVAHLIDHSEMAAIFVGNAKNWSDVKPLVTEKLQCVGLPNAKAGEFDLTLASICNDFLPLPLVEAEDKNCLMSIVYTSGTTGVPKGVTITAGSYFQSCKGYSDFLKTNQDSRFFSFLPLSHIAERVLVWGQSLVTGGVVFFNKGLESFQQDVYKAKPTILFGVPRIYENFQSWAREKFGWDELETQLNDPLASETTAREVREFLGLNSIECALVGSAPITEEVHLWYEKIGMPLCELWGQSEILPATASRPSERKPGSVGKPVPGCELKISAEGEVLAKAEFMTQGYWQNQKETDATLVDGWLHTGDRGEIDDDGFLYLKGRIKETFKTAKGKYVSPVPIEEKFSVNPYIDQLCLTGSGRIQTYLLVVLSEEAKRQSQEQVSLSFENTLVEINPSLENHERVGSVIICDEPWTIANGLLTHSMKLKRFAIESEYKDVIIQAEKAEGKVFWEAMEASACTNA